MGTRKFYLSDYYNKLHSATKKYGKPAGPDRIEFIRNNTGRDKIVLDLGCRDGMLTRYIMEGNTVFGADIDSTALYRCKSEYGIRVCNLDLNQQLPFRDEVFDVVIAAEVMEHLPIPANLVIEAGRVLKKGGIFIGTVPNAYRVKTRIEFFMGKPLTRDESHLRFFNYDTLEKTLSEYFRHTEIIPMSGHILGNSKRGIPVRNNTPLWIGKLFAAGLSWKARKI
jgi:SAM-dependent methyltransferase